MSADPRNSYGERLESRRLWTRKLTEENFDVWSPFFEDEASIAFLPVLKEGSPRERSEHWIRRQNERYANKQFGLQALMSNESGQLIGQCGLLLQDVDGKEETEVGYHILKPHRRSGYATEAAKLFIDYVFKYKLSDSVISIIDVNNLNSQRVARKNGLSKEKRIEWRGLDVFIYRIQK